MVQEEKKEERVKIVTPVGRFVYSHLIKPDTEGAFATQKRGTKLMIPKGSKSEEKLLTLKAELEKEATRIFGKLSDKELPLKLPIRDGDNMGTEGKFNVFAKSWVLSALTKYEVKLLRKDGSLMGEVEAEDYFYSGAWGRLEAIMNTYAKVETVKVRENGRLVEVKEEQKGVNLYLLAAQFARHDDKLGGYEPNFGAWEEGDLGEDEVSLDDVSF